MIAHFAWANGEFLRGSGTSLLALPLRDLVDASYRLQVLWFSQDEDQMKQVESIEKYFRDRETEYETGELILPGWASVGNVGSQYGDDASPFG